MRAVSVVMFISHLFVSEGRKVDANSGQSVAESGSATISLQTASRDRVRSESCMKFGAFGPPLREQPGPRASEMAAPPPRPPADVTRMVDASRTTLHGPRSSRSAV